MELCRVRVVGQGAAADVALPSQVPLADVLPDLLLLVAPMATAPPPRPWTLLHPVRGPLSHTSTLAEAGVVDGTVLLLSEGPTSATPAVVVEDVPEAVGDALAARSRRFGIPAARWAGGAMVAAAAGVFSARGLPSGAAGVVSLGVGAVCSALGIAVGQMARMRAVGTALAMGALAWWALGAATVTSEGEHRVQLVVAGGMVGVAVASILGLLSPGARRAAAGSLVASVSIGAQFALLGRPGHADLLVAAAAIPVLLTLVIATPAAVPRMVGLGALGDGATTDDVVEQRVGQGRALQGWVVGGLLVGLAPAVAVVVSDPGWSGRLLAAALGLALGARARRSRHLEEAAPATVAAVVVLVGLAVAVARSEGGSAVPIAAAALVAGGVLLLGGSTLTGGSPRPVAAKLGDAVEVLALAACVPAALATGGLLEAITSVGG